MAIASIKLGYGKGGVKLITLYDNIADVGGAASAFPVQAGGKTLYAKIGDITHAQASAFTLGKGGIKRLLLKASTVLTLKDLNVSSSPSERVTMGASGTNVTIKNTYPDDTDKTQMFFTINIPQNAKNPKLSFDWTAGGKPAVEVTYGFGSYSTLLHLDASSTQTEGHIDISLVNKGGYYWYFDVLSYAGGTYTKYFAISNFKIEYEDG